MAAEVVEAYPDGVWLAEFAPIADPALILKTVASPLSVPEQPGRDITETLVDALRSKALLVVLDKCEHVLRACRDLTAVLLRRCPQARMLATSREGLGVPGETLWRVPSLSLPEYVSHRPAAAELLLYDASPPVCRSRSNGHPRVYCHKGECARRGSGMLAPGRHPAGD